MSGLGTTSGTTTVSTINGTSAPHATNGTIAKAVTTAAPATVRASVRRSGRSAMPATRAKKTAPNCQNPAAMAAVAPASAKRSRSARKSASAPAASVKYFGRMPCTGYRYRVWQREHRRTGSDRRHVLTGGFADDRPGEHDAGHDCGGRDDAAEEMQHGHVPAGKDGEDGREVIDERWFHVPNIDVGSRSLRDIPPRVLEQCRPGVEGRPRDDKRVCGNDSRKREREVVPSDEIICEKCRGDCEENNCPPVVGTPPTGI